jgi:hypothetical protein
MSDRDVGSEHARNAERLIGHRASTFVDEAIVSGLLALYHETRHQSDVLARQSAEMVAHTKALEAHRLTMLRHCDSLDHAQRQPPSSRGIF